MVRRYILLINTQSSTIFQKVFDYCRYQTVNYARYDTDGFLIDSYSSPSEIMDYFSANISYGAEFFICEVTGEIAWRNAYCGFNDLNRFLG